MMHSAWLGDESEDDDPSDNWKLGVSDEDLPSFTGQDSDGWSAEVSPDDLASNIQCESHEFKQFSRGRTYELEGCVERQGVPVKMLSYLTVSVANGAYVEEVSISRGKCLGRLCDCPWFPKDALPAYLDWDELLVFVGIPEHPDYAQCLAYFAFVVHYEQVGSIISHASKR